MSFAIWITGPPGSGKSTIAREAARRLAAAGRPVRVLELDEVRKVVTPAPTYSEAERDIVYRALAYMAKLLVEVGQPVIVDATAHRRAWRDLARRLVPRFAEVELDCPLEVRAARERSRREGHAPRGIYARAEEPGATVPGVNVPYESSAAPELRLDTAGTDLEQQVEAVVGLARRLDPESGAGEPSPAPRAPERRDA
ncbi:MAG TPA: adenylyl-sulfate kinase [Thermodesulfobacteriota bacterium]